MKALIFYVITLQALSPILNAPLPDSNLAGKLEPPDDGVQNHEDPVREGKWFPGHCPVFNLIGNHFSTGHNADIETDDSAAGVSGLCDVHQNILENVVASLTVEQETQVRNVLKEFENEEKSVVETDLSDLSSKLVRASRLVLKLEESENSVITRLCKEGGSSCQDKKVRDIFSRLSSGLNGGCGSSYDVSCEPSEQYRRMDGRCNNLEDKEKGAYGTLFGRFLMNAYEDGVFTPRGGFNPSKLPNPRVVSVNLHQGENVVSNNGITHMAMQFGQFLAHDITHTSEEKLDCCKINDLNSPSRKRCFNIDVNSDPFYSINGVSCQPFTRSVSRNSTKSKVRNQINGATAFIDASPVYGSIDETAKKLRTLKDGLLKINSDKAHPSLPTRQQCGFSSVGDQKPSHIVSGGSRVMVQPALAAMHTLFMIEHNRIAKELKDRLENFLKGKTTEQKDTFLFQESRKILIGELQNIAYNEYLPLILGEERVLANELKLQVSSSYDQTIDPAIRNEFATVAFRFGHTMINGTFKVIGPEAKSFLLRHSFCEFENLVLNQDGNGWKNHMRGVIRQPCPGADLHFTEDVTNFLFANHSADPHTQPFFGQDLVALNIQRGRDHGIPSYNKLRSICGLSNIETFASRPDEISAEIWDKLQTVYTSVDDIDGFTGGLAETIISDGLVGPTFACIIAKQFNFLMYGDRFFFTHTSQASHVTGLKSQSKSQVLGRTLGDILCDNADISETQANVFKEISVTNPELLCSSRKGLNFEAIAREITS